jgi:hypothetical protein
MMPNIKWTESKESSPKLDMCRKHVFLPEKRENWEDDIKEEKTFYYMNPLNLKDRKGI